jgi:hypothetical protein
MIVKIHKGGKSFSGAATYLTHDPKAKTDERVAWTHTLNLANDHVPSAVDEMLWTARNAELLKQEAGIRAGGRATENPVKHVSLNWAPDENPTRDHMIETTEDFLRHMKWQEHQALLVAHEDKEYAHVHVLLNAVHPETGLRLDDNFERRRAQECALEYERENGRIYCEQRLKNLEEREDGPTRPAWMAFRENHRKFENQEKILENKNDPILIRDPEIPENTNSDEWRILKEIQRDERKIFFGEGKLAFNELRNSTYREIRKEFRERWSDYYAAEKNGGDGVDLAAMKAEIVAEQKTALEERRDAACAELRKSRDGQYRELLDDQREIRLGLHSRQEAGLENALFLDLARDGNAGRDIATTFREAADETLMPRDGDSGWEMDASAYEAPPRHENAGMKSGANIGANIGEGLGFGLIAFLDSIADGFIGAKPAPKPRQREPEHSGPNPFDAAADEAHKRQQQEEQNKQEEADREWRKRQRSGYGE